MSALAEVQERLNQIAARKAEMKPDVERLAAVDDLTDEQRSEWDAFTTELDALETEEGPLIDRAADLTERARRAEALRDLPFNINPVVEERLEAVDVTALRPLEARDMALRAVDERSKSSGSPLRTDQLDKLDGLLRQRDRNVDGAIIARRLIVTENDHYRSAFVKLVTQTTPVLTPEEARAVQAYNEFRAMSEGTTTAGGFGIPVLIDPSIILTSQGSLNPFRKISRQVTITTNIWKGVSSAGVSWSYDGEATAVSDDSPTLAQPSVTTYMARGFIPYSIEVGMDYPGFASEMSTLLNEGYDELQAQAFATGTGSGQPFGIITALDATTAVEVTPTTDGAFGAVDINKVWGALPDRYKANATWVMNHDVGNEVSTFSPNGAGSFFTTDLTGTVETLKKRPVEYASYFPDFTGTTGASNILVVGDFRNYLIVDRAGMEVELVPHLFDVTNNRPTGERGWFAHARHGADSVNDLGFRLLQNQ